LNKQVVASGKTQKIFITCMTLITYSENGLVMIGWCLYFDDDGSVGTKVRDFRF
jgi:hypothetical protein